jgi:hypothetical protein
VKNVSFALAVRAKFASAAEAPMTEAILQSG